MYMYTDPMCIGPFMRHIKQTKHGAYIVHLSLHDGEGMHTTHI